MEIEEKIKVLKSRETKNLVEKLHEYEDALEKALRENASFKDLNRGYLGSGDCQEVKRIMAELAAQAPETKDAGRKMTIADKDAWLLRQRTENEELVGALNRQKNVTFIIENNEITAEMARRRLEGIRAMVALTTQQIAFLASG